MMALVICREPMAWLKGGEVDGNDGAIARIGESVIGNTA
jgi:hypothetical protein